MRKSMGIGVGRLLALLVLAALIIPGGARGVERQARGGWLEIRYGELVDGRQLSHSGDSVAALLGRLQGRPLPPPGERPADRLNHVLLDPLLEPYAFVLQDALDSLAPMADPPMVELGYLWAAGEAQPAWAELLRARRYLVESDGAGRMRVCLPAEGDSPEVAETARMSIAKAAPVLRHIFKAEMSRLEGSSLHVAFHVYRHFPATSAFALSVEPVSMEISETLGSGYRPPLDLEAIDGFLKSGLQLEGARLESDGSLVLLGSPAAEPPTVLGRRIEMSDLAVAYRAVFHGGLAEPYMSLDRGYSPQTAIVNYGGRLRDTALGMVSLLCDIRFKTFSLGLGIEEGQDLRELLRGGLPSFRTHLERFAAHPQSQEVMGQQTRLWFYPDRVDLTLSPQGDAMLLRKVRMSAASERFISASMSEAARGEDPPWTMATIEAINRDYEALASLFPEMADLDQVVRLLSLFAWLKQAEIEGVPVPDLDVLMAVELPAIPTPRTFPQLLAFNALPPAGGDGEVVTLDRVAAAEALERLNPYSGRPLPAKRRLARAVAGLDQRKQINRSLMEEIAGESAKGLGDDELDVLAHRAERLRMHQTVLATLEPEKVQELAERQQTGERLRVFSVAIGGLDLGMGRVVARAAGRSMALGGAAAVLASAQRQPAESSVRVVRREDWRSDPPTLPVADIPAHGLTVGTISRGRSGEAGPEERWVWCLMEKDSPELVSRRVVLDPLGRALSVDRMEGGRRLRYRFEREGAVLKAALLPMGEEGDEERTWIPEGGLPQGTGLLQVIVGEAPVGNEPAVRLRLHGETTSLEADFPRTLLQRLVVGPEADLQPGRPLRGLDPLPRELGMIGSMLVALNRSQLSPPWEESADAVAGEENPIRLARALNVWWSGKSRSAVVATDPAESVARWQSAPRPGSSALLLLPQDAFPGRLSTLREQLGRSWNQAAVVGRLPEKIDEEMVVLVSGESPGQFASRLRALAEEPAMEGKLLAAWGLTSPVREDLPASLLSAGKLAGIGIAEASVVGSRTAAEHLGALRRALALQVERRSRAEELSPFLLWYF